MVDKENENTNLNEVLKVKINYFDDKYTMIVDPTFVRKNKTLIKEPEVIRIVKALNNENCKTGVRFEYVKDLLSVSIAVKKYEKKEDGELTVIYYPYNRINSISEVSKYHYKKLDTIVYAKDTDKYYKCIDNSKNESLKPEDRFIVLEDSDRPKEITVTYKRLLCSSGNVRNKKVIYINKDIYDKAHEILLCGMPKDMEYDVFAKYNSYYAMANTDSIPIDSYDGESMVVVDDYKHNITEHFDIVREYERDKYKVKNNQEKTITIAPFDGAGLIHKSLARQWSEELKLKYTPSAWQFRQIPGIKGNLYTFDIAAFAKLHNITKIKDIWGKEWDIFNKDGSLKIKIIMTKSQFKFWRVYKELAKVSNDETNGYMTWLNVFKTELYNYKRTFNISKFSESPNEIKDKVIMSYQPIQSLDLDETQINYLCEDTVNLIRDITNNVDSFCEFRGLNLDEYIDVTEDSLENIILEAISDAMNNVEYHNPKNKQSYISEYYKALEKCKILFNDDWIAKKVHDDIEGIKKRSKKGGIVVGNRDKGIYANYQTLIPDLYALAQAACGIKVTGLLDKDEVYSQYWLDRNVEKISLIRFPHIAKEHKISNVVLPKQVIKNEKGKDIKLSDFYKYCTEGIMVSICDSTAIRLGGADFDNDHILTNNDPTICQAISNEDIRTIYYIKDYKEKPKNESKEITPQVKKIDDMKVLIKTDLAGMKQSIGDVVNLITKLWSLRDTASEEDKIKIDKYIKIMSVVGSKTIDFAKSGIEGVIPDEIVDFLKKEGNGGMPYFQRFVDNNKGKIKQEKKRNKVAEINGGNKIEIFSKRDCTMQRLCQHVEQEIELIENERKEFLKSLSDEKKVFPWAALIKNKDINVAGNKTYEDIVETIIELRKEHNQIAGSTEFGEAKAVKEEKDARFRLFYEYCKATLLEVFFQNRKNNTGKIDNLIDYVIYAHYNDSRVVKHNEDKGIIWNCFGKEINKRLQGKPLSEFEDEKIIKLSEQSSRKKKVFDNAKSKNDIINFNIKVGKKLVDLNSDVLIMITANEIKHLQKLYGKLERPEKNLAYTLLVLYKAFKLKKLDFKLYFGSKNVMTRSKICKLNDGMKTSVFQDILIELKEKELINTDRSKKDYLIIDVAFEDNAGKEKFIITNLQQIGKYFGKI